MPEEKLEVLMYPEELERSASGYEQPKWRMWTSGENEA